MPGILRGLSQKNNGKFVVASTSYCPPNLSKLLFAPSYVQFNILSPSSSSYELSDTSINRILYNLGLHFYLNDDREQIQKPIVSNQPLIAIKSLGLSKFTSLSHTFPDLTQKLNNVDHCRPTRRPIIPFRKISERGPTPQSGNDHRQIIQQSRCRSISDPH